VIRGRTGIVFEVTYLRYLLLIVAAALLYGGWHFGAESLAAVNQSNTTVHNPNSKVDDHREELNALSHSLSTKSWVCYGLGALAVVASIACGNRQLSGRTTIR
jgi:hypothetical protein